jgi:hypothetical protein
MRPKSTELMKGMQGALMTYILPEMQSDYARTGLMLMQALLGVAINDIDDAAQNLVDENAALRSLAGEAAGVLAENPLVGHEALAGELQTLASGHDNSVRLSALRSGNDDLRRAVAELGAALVGSTSPQHVELRAGVVAHLRQELERLPHNLMGARADG